MVKMTYKGVMAEGIANFPGGKINVTRGHEYDIPQSAVDSLLASCEWELSNGIKVEDVKKVKKSTYDDDEDD